MRFYIKKDNQKIYIIPGIKISLRYHFVALHKRDSNEFSFDNDLINKSNVSEIIAEPSTDYSIGLAIILPLLLLIFLSFDQNRVVWKLPLLISALIIIFGRISCYYDKQAVKKFNNS